MLQKIHDVFGKWVVVLILGLISLTFIFWGINRSDLANVSGTASFAASVNGEKIPLQEFDRELQARQNQYQQIYRGELPEELRRQLRQSVIDDLVQRTALTQRVRDEGYRASAARIDASIMEIAAFQVDGVYNDQRANAALRTQGSRRWVSARKSENASRSGISQAASSIRRS